MRAAHEGEVHRTSHNCASGRQICAVRRSDITSVSGRWIVREALSVDRRIRTMLSREAAAGSCGRRGGRSTSWCRRRRSQLSRRCTAKRSEVRGAHAHMAAMRAVTQKASAPDPAGEQHLLAVSGSLDPEVLRRLALGDEQRAHARADVCAASQLMPRCTRGLPGMGGTGVSVQAGAPFCSGVAHTPGPAPPPRPGLSPPGPRRRKLGALDGVRPGPSRPRRRRRPGRRRRPPAVGVRMPKPTATGRPDARADAPDRDGDRLSLRQRSLTPVTPATADVIDEAGGALHHHLAAGGHRPWSERVRRIMSTGRLRRPACGGELPRFPPVGQVDHDQRVDPGGGCNLRQTAL